MNFARGQHHVIFDIRWEFNLGRGIRNQVPLDHGPKEMKQRRYTDILKSFGILFPIILYLLCLND